LKVEELESKLAESSQLREEIASLKRHENQGNVEKLQAEIKICETLKTKTEIEIEELKLAIDELKVEKKEMKLELNVAKSDVKTERMECKQQIDFFRKNQNELKSQWNTTSILEKRESQNNLEFKSQENAELSEKLQRKEDEIAKLKKENNILRGIQR
jgi:chromosome segregation ATPase